jgi:phosphoribosylformylglycinamidine cyclo-ligase
MYHGNDYDLAGFCVGVVERSEIIDGSRVKAGDAIIGLASSGVHSNGYSLVRKLIAVAGANEATMLAGRTLFDRLLEPTRIYVRSMLKLSAALPVSAYAHITGGGITDNIPRVLPAGLEAHLVRSRWHQDPLFDWLAATGSIADAEMYRTFNCGIGMIAVVPPAHVAQALQLLHAQGETATVIGEIRAGNSGVVIDA